MVPWAGMPTGLKMLHSKLTAKNISLQKTWVMISCTAVILVLDRRIWQFAAQGKTPQPWLELKYNSADGEEGFPGNLGATIRFELSHENELSYEFKAVCDKATVVNLTHHGYFNLNNGKELLKTMK